MKRHGLVIGSVAATLVASLPVWAQQAAPMPGMTMPGQSGGQGQASMMSGMDKMMKDMAAVPMTGNADQDFVGMMKPHHQGAIDMARYELANGKDPAMLKMARDIIAAQEKEIAEMNAWQAKNPVHR
jgi:uncharacterized protein (DUF305 family)